jgi:hypothetical protein
MTTHAAVVHVRNIIPRATDEQRDGLHRTPAIATRGLLAVEPWLAGVNVWEPACGDGAISKVLEKDGDCRVLSTDLVDHGYGRRADFLTCQRPRFKYRVILTNPPFRFARDFVDRGIELRAQKVIILARLLWLEGDSSKNSKREWFEQTGLTRVWVFSKRINVPPARYKEVREDGTGGMVAFAWYVWERGHRGLVTLGFIGRKEMGL